MTAEDIRNSVLRHIELHVDSAPTRYLYSDPGTALSSTDCATMPLNVLSLEPCYGGSHKAFLDGWHAHSRHQWTCLTLPPYKWQWRMRHAAVTTKQVHLGASSWPVFERGNMIRLDNGDLLAPLHGLFKEDTKTRPKAPHAGQSRVILCRSSDRGHTWRYHATVATGARDPNPELPGQYNGPCEPSLEMLPNGQLICVFRTQSSHYPGEYRPISVCWSNALGRTWTKPLPTQPHLMNSAPKLIVLENGVVALEYGRPGFHIAFSLDNGHTWQDRVSFSHLPCGTITGQFDMAKAGPNKLVAIGNDGGGTKVWPLAE